MNEPSITIKKPIYMLSWPGIIPMHIKQQLADIFSGHDYMVAASITPLHVCQCSQNCPAIVVNITGCRDLGMLPVALCRFSYSWHNGEREKVDNVLHQCGCIPNSPSFSGILLPMIDFGFKR